MKKNMPGILSGGKRIMEVITKADLLVGPTGATDEVQINQAWMQRETGMTPQTWCKHIQELRCKYEIVRGRRGSLLRRRRRT